MLHRAGPLGAAAHGVKLGGRGDMVDKDVSFRWCQVFLHHLTIMHYGHDRRGFIHQAMQAGVTPLTVERPSGGGNSARVASEIASLMVNEGVARTGVDFRVYKAGSMAPVRVSFISTYASTKKCGDWSTDLSDTSENTAYPNLGCAVQTNLAAMVADPDTLVVPKTKAPKVSGPDVAAVYRAESYSNSTTLLTNYKYSSSP